MTGDFFLIGDIYTTKQYCVLEALFVNTLVQSMVHEDNGHEKGNYFTEQVIVVDMT